MFCLDNSKSICEAQSSCEILWLGFESDTMSFLCLGTIVLLFLSVIPLQMSSWLIHTANSPLIIHGIHPIYTCLLLQNPLFQRESDVGSLWNTPLPWRNWPARLYLVPLTVRPSQNLGEIRKPTVELYWSVFQKANSFTFYGR